MASLFRCQHWRVLSRDAALYDIRQRYTAEIKVDLVAEFFPEIMCRATAFLAAATDRLTGRAAGGANGLIHREDDIRHPYLIGGAGQKVAAAMAADGRNQSAPPHLCKELFQI